MSSPSTLQDIQFLRSQPLASLVQKEIERQILSGELAAGKRLNELAIARTLGISRAPVRECLRTLEQMVARMEKARAKRDAVAYHEINMAFHELMVELVGNRKLLNVYRKLLHELTLYRRQSLAQPGAMDHSAAEHREILAAIKSGEGDAAGRVMRDHIMASSGRLQRAHEAPRTRKTK